MRTTLGAILEPRSSVVAPPYNQVAQQRDRDNASGSDAPGDYLGIDTTRHLGSATTIRSAPAKLGWVRRTLKRSSQRLLAIDDLEDLELSRYPALPLVCRAYELCANVTPYDAVHVALAERLGATQLTADQRLSSAPGITCPIETLTD